MIYASRKVGICSVKSNKITVSGSTKSYFSGRPPTHGTPYIGFLGVLKWNIIREKSVGVIFFDYTRRILILYIKFSHRLITSIFFLPFLQIRLRRQDAEN